ncbi:MAG: DHHW family protein [Clostridia bacterium]|nr:DHHW family protein [Clostridia bacterium]
MAKKLKVIRFGGMYGTKKKKKTAAIIILSAVICVTTATLGALYPFYGDSLWKLLPIKETSSAPSQIDISSDDSENNDNASSQSTDDNETDTSSAIPELSYSSDAEGAFADETQKVYVFDKVAYEVFYGDNTGADAYADTINNLTVKLKKLLGDETKFYDLVIPTRSEFTLPDQQKIKAGTYSQRININRIAEKLSDDIKCINVIDTLMQHRDEYTYFNTDSVWTSLGAYYGYEHLMQSMGLEPVALDELKKGVNRVEGDYIGLTGNSTSENSALYSQIKSNADTVEYYDIPGEYTVKIIANDGSATVADLYYPSPTSTYAYAVFLFGGESPVMTISADNPTESGRNLLVIKDSSANPFVPYLTCNFNKVTVVDYRYFDGTLENLLKDEKPDDVLFLNGIMDANTAIRNSSMSALLN